MSAEEVIAEIKSLGSREREQVIRFLVNDKSLREDLQDSLLLEARADESSRPLDEVLRDLGV
jgi:hypothetical protein